MTKYATTINYPNYIRALIKALKNARHRYMLEGVKANSLEFQNNEAQIQILEHILKMGNEEPTAE